MLDQVAEELPGLLELGQKARETDGHGSAVDQMEEVLLGDDPAQILQLLKQSIRNGAPLPLLSRQVAYAAAMRICRFGTSNEYPDLITGQHILLGASRYVAAHSPTERQNLQTAQIARRLLRGESLYAKAD